MGCWLSYSARKPCVNRRCHQKWQRCPIRQEWIRFMGDHGQQAFSPGLCLSFLRVAIQTTMQPYPMAETIESPGVGCRGRNKPAQTPTAALRTDYIVGNPPFHLKWQTEGGRELPSQMYFCVKAAALLKPLDTLGWHCKYAFYISEAKESLPIRHVAARL